MALNFILVIKWSVVSCEEMQEWNAVKVHEIHTDLINLKISKESLHLRLVLQELEVANISNQC